MYGKDVKGTVAFEQQFSYIGYFAEIGMTKVINDKIKNGTIAYIPNERAMTVTERRDGELPRMEEFCFIDGEWYKATELPEDKQLEVTEDGFKEYTDSLENELCIAKAIRGMRKRKGLYVNYLRKGLTQANFDRMEYKFQQRFGRHDDRNWA